MRFTLKERLELLCKAAEIVEEHGCVSRQVFNPLMTSKWTAGNWVVTQLLDAGWAMYQDLLAIASEEDLCVATTPTSPPSAA